MMVCGFAQSVETTLYIIRVNGALFVIVTIIYWRQNMKVTSCKWITEAYIEMDHEGNNQYRTNGKGNWEMLFGEDWISVYDREMLHAILQQAFLEYMERFVNNQNKEAL